MIKIITFTFLSISGVRMRLGSSVFNTVLKCLSELAELSEDEDAECVLLGIYFHK